MDYASYRSAMLKRIESANEYKHKLALAYKGFLMESNIVTMGAELDEILTEAQWNVREEKRKQHAAWVLENHDTFVKEAFDLLNKTLCEERIKKQTAITDAQQLADTWTLKIPSGKKDQEALAKQLKTEWRFKDAISGLNALKLEALLTAKIADHKKDLAGGVQRRIDNLSRFDEVAAIWESLRILSLDELQAENTRLRREEKPVLASRTSEGVSDYNTKMSVLNDKLKVIHKLIQMNTKGIRCMDEWRGFISGVSLFFELP